MHLRGSQPETRAGRIEDVDGRSGRHVHASATRLGLANHPHQVTPRRLTTATLSLCQNTVSFPSRAGGALLDGPTARDTQRRTL